MTYEYPWYVMLALMIVAGAVVFLVCRSVDLALEWFLDRRQARMDADFDRQLDDAFPRRHDDRG